ncbi:MAG TPA: TolC family protein [Candidatus Cybelea sp.]|nr:TolC family protein [Candidatus Cybelea sp.]
MKSALLLTLLLYVVQPLLGADAPTNSLTLAQARELALKQHPKISVANLTALAAHQATKQVQSALLPSIFGYVTAVGNADPNNTRIAAGGLNNPLIYEREAQGVSISQLITDFGRSSDLTKSAQLRERSEKMNVDATRAQILLEVDNAFFSSLESQLVLEVARETVSNRAFILQQTQALATNKLRSELDLSFASVDYDQAKILLAKAQIDVQASFAVLSDVLGEPRAKTYHLTDEPMAAYVTNNSSALILEALAQRPDLVQARYQRDAVQEFAQAQARLNYPTLSAVGAAGEIPTGNSHLGPDYAAAGINLTLPLYEGGLNAGLRREAQFRAKAAEEAVRDQEDNIARDVQVTSLSLDYAWQRLALTEELLRNANKALQLSQARFKNGISSIIELSQAELNQTSADIAAADARYNYQIQRSALDFQLGRLR